MSSQRIEKIKGFLLQLYNCLITEDIKFTNAYKVISRKEKGTILLSRNATYHFNDIIKLLLDQYGSKGVLSLEEQQNKS